MSRGRASAAKNAMLRFVARVLIARQHDLWGTGGLLCCILGLCFPHPRHKEPQRPFGIVKRLIPAWARTWSRSARRTKARSDNQVRPDAIHAHGTPGLTARA